MPEINYTILINSISSTDLHITVTRVGNEVGRPVMSPTFSTQILIESWDLIRKGDTSRFITIADEKKLQKKARETEAAGEFSMFYDYLYGSKVPLNEEESLFLQAENDEEIKKNIPLLQAKVGFKIAQWGKDETTYYVISEPSFSSFKLEAQEVIESEEEIERGIDENNNDFLTYTFTVFEDYYFDHLIEGLSWNSTLYPL
jgi:hypothetical protein